MAWVLLSYEPISTFELRPSNTTKTGGKTLLCPTPYAIKMALLDRMIRFNGESYGRDHFPFIRDLVIHARPPLAISINRTFQKILRPAKKGEWNSTIALREFCIQAGTLELAIQSDIDDGHLMEVLVQTASAVNYFGQRGSFFQLVAVDELQTLDGFVDLSRPVEGLRMGFLQHMDDMSLQADFDDVSVYNPRSKGGRQAYNVVFPYKLKYNGFNHSVWERIS